MKGIEVWCDNRWDDGRMIIMATDRWSTELNNKHPMSPGGIFFGTDELFNALIFYDDIIHENNIKIDVPDGVEVVIRAIHLDLLPFSLHIVSPHKVHITSVPDRIYNG